MHYEQVYICYLLSIVLQLGFILYFFTRVFSLAQKTLRYTPHIPVSVVICARNEAENLRKYLPAILAQRYVNVEGNTIFEVIVVNDCSTDHTDAVLDKLEKIYTNLKIVHLSPDEQRVLPGKKFALSKGVAVAAHDVLVLTDADCEPLSALWLMQMAKPFTEGKELVSGYGQYRTTKGMLNSFIRWETVHAFLQFSTYALAGRPYMAVGRNMACTKAAFLKAQGSPQWGKLPSGDDDLLVRAVGGKDNVAVVSNRGAFTLTDAKPNWAAWTQQKQRHLSTGKYYKSITLFFLTLYGVSHAVAWLSCIYLLFTPMWGEALVVMLLRCAVYWMVWQRTACILNEKKLVRFFPLFDLGWLVYNFVFSPYIFWKNKQQWTSS